MKALSFLLPAAFVASMAQLPLAPAGTGKASHLVAIDAMAFSPALIEVKAGDTITWKNSDPFPHNVVSGRDFASPEIASGGAWTYKAGRKGRFVYVCTLHPTMRAEIVVR